MPSALTSAPWWRGPVAVIAGGDAHRTYPAKASANVISQGLSELGYAPVTIELGPGAEAELLASGARLAMNAALDSRLDDGGVSELCETLGIICIGADEIACRITADKAICSGLLAAAGIASPRQKVVSRSRNYTLGVRAALPLIAAQMGPRVVVKPRYGAAGAGVRMVDGIEHIPAAVTSAFKYHDAIVIQPAISGREYTVLISGTPGDLWAVGVAEVLYGDSGDSGSTAWGRTYEPVFGIAAGKLQKAIATARRAAGVVGCTGLASVDLIIDENGKEWIFDIDCMVDWAPSGCLPACLATNEVTEDELLASLLAEVGPAIRLAA